MYPVTAATIAQTKELWDELQAALAELAVRVLFEQADMSEWKVLEGRLERMKPDVLFLDVNSVREPLGDVIARIRSHPHAPAVFVIHTETNPEAILAAMREGASEYLVPPLTDGLRKGLERVAAQRERTRESVRRGGRNVGFASAKGGCGATTIACHIAVEVAAQTKGQVLLADLDIEAGLVGFLMKSQSSYSIGDAVANLNRLDPSYWRGLISNGYPGVEVIAAPSTPRAKNIDWMQTRHVLNFVRGHYDWTVADLGRNLNAGSLQTLEAIDELLIVSHVDVAALHQAKNMAKLLVEAGYGRDRIKLILNRVPRKMEVTLEELENMLGVPVLVTIPDEYEALQEAMSDGKLLPPGSSLGKHYLRLARKIAGIPEEAPKKRFGLFG